MMLASGWALDALVGAVGGICSTNTGGMGGISACVLELVARLELEKCC